MAVEVIKESRELRLQPFNEYRKRFNLKPYTSFQELTGKATFGAHCLALKGPLAEWGDVEERERGSACAWLSDGGLNGHRPPPGQRLVLKLGLGRRFLSADKKAVLSR